MRYSSRGKCLRLVADRSLDKSYSSRSKALFHSNGDAGLISDESPRLVAAHKRALAEGGGLRLVIPDRSRVLRTFTMVGVIPRFASLEEALPPGPSAASPSGAR